MDASEDGPGGSVFRRVPHVLLTKAEVEAAVQDLMRYPYFVVDIETTSLNPRTNDVLWIGLGAFGSVYLIPMGHPKGALLKPRRKEKVTALLAYGDDDPRAYTPATRKLPKEQRRVSLAMVDVWQEAIYAEPPVQLRITDVLPILEPLLFSDRGKIGHNVKFDLSSLAKYYKREIPGPYHDTILVRHTLSEDLQSYELKPLICDWFGVPYAKREKFYPNIGKAGITNFGLDEIAYYLAKDCRFCWLMFQRYYHLLVRKGLQQVYDFEMQVYPVIMRMENYGFPVQLDELESARTDLYARMKEVESAIFAIAGDEFSVSSPDAKRWVLFGEGIPEYGVSKKRLKTQKLRVLVRTPKKKEPAATAAVLDYYAERGNKMAELLAEWAILEKLRGTFIEGIRGFLNHHENGELPTIHTGYKQHGTVTGRLSAAQPNLQQLPRGSTIRKLFVSGEGQVLIVADYDQIELRCLAKEADERNMIGIFKDGRDIHREATAAAMQIRIEDVTDELRQVGKTLNFATGYGAGPERIAAVAGVSVERGSEFLDRYYEAFPMLNRWKYRELQLARKRGDRANPLLDPPRVLIPPYGRIRRLPDLFVLDGQTDGEGNSIVWRRYRAERQAINAIIQGFASYVTKMAMLALDKDVPYPMLAQVHDEIIFRVPEDEAYKVLPLVTEIMGSITDPFTGEPILGEIPLVASAAIGTSWADAKKKAA